MKDEIKIFKFGGNSFCQPENYFKVLKIIREQQPHIVVVSAIGKTTNMLDMLFEVFWQKDFKEVADCFLRIELFTSNSLLVIQDNAFRERIKKVLEELKETYLKRTALTNSKEIEKDRLLVWGEWFSAQIFQQFLSENEVESEWVDAGKFMFTNLQFGNASLNEAKTETAIRDILLPLVLEKKIVITQGFTGRGEINTPFFSFSGPTTFGRKTSDLSAILIAGILKKLIKDSVEVTLWKNVKGMATRDPRFSSEDVSYFSTISYQQAREVMRVQPTQLLHPKSIDAAEQVGIQLTIKKFDQPELGTIIH